MPSIEAGREKVMEFVKKNGIAIEDLAIAYGMQKTDVYNYLTGKSKTPKANQLILRIITDYKIR